MEQKQKIKDFVFQYKNAIIVILIAVLALFVFGDGLPFAIGKGGAETVAVNFMEAMYKGDAEKCVSFMCDELIELSGHETKKLFINAMKKQYSSLIDTYKKEYGNDWKYEIDVIDSFEYTPPYDCDEELIKVVLSIKHKGKVWFNEKEGEEEIELAMVERDGKWLVYDME